MLMAIDTTLCESYRPGGNGPLESDFYTGWKKQHGLKYEIGVCIQTRQPCWVSDAFSAKDADSVVVRSSGLLDHLLPGELVLADKGYVGAAPQVMAPFRPARNAAQEEFNHAIKTHRYIIENLIGRIKVFGFASQRWRHNILLHEMCFKTVAHLVALDIRFRPL
jgi:hypothetical protein